MGGFLLFLYLAVADAVYVAMLSWVPLCAFCFAISGGLERWEPHGGGMVRWSVRSL
jgi:hypothetical protein